MVGSLGFWFFYLDRKVRNNVYELIHDLTVVNTRGFGSKTVFARHIGLVYYFVAAIYPTSVDCFGLYSFRWDSFHRGSISGTILLLCVYLGTFRAF
ncbi:hypothetical protein BJX66DRAFT_309096 [Aspergillus keveii]|uniref:Uncharacterized protein n=1 Tax=Aspergillus keveii TaxID=714993 RepID=A0ABR4FYG7_9EURO